MNEEIKNLIQNTPNDAELGRRIRALYNMLYGNNQSPFGSSYVSTTTQEGYNNNKKTLLNG
jgi:hypothetical protein